MLSKAIESACADGVPANRPNASNAIVRISLGFIVTYTSPASLVAIVEPRRRFCSARDSLNVLTEAATGDGPESPFKETIVGKCVSFELALEPNDIFFGIVQRGAAVIMLKHIGVDPIPQSQRVPDPNLPAFSKALEEQLGLKLGSTRGPVDVLVIDHIERPTED